MRRSSVSSPPGEQEGRGEEASPGEQPGTAGWHHRQPRSTSLLSPHLHDVSEIAIALTHPAPHFGNNNRKGEPRGRRAPADVGGRSHPRGSPA